MSPYYDDGQCVIYHSQCETILPGLSDIGLVITSPPYNLNRDLNDEPYEAVHDRKSRARTDRSHRFSDGYTEHDDGMTLADYRAWQQRVISDCWEALRNDGAIYYNHKPRAQWSKLLLPTAFVPDHCSLRQIIIWDRDSVSMSSSPRAYAGRHEWIVLIAKDDFRLKSRSASATATDLWRFKPEMDDNGHPCPFPLTLPARILETATVNGPVLDPFMGSGTTLVAAKATGLKSIGVERSERYCEIAAKRLAQGVLDFGGAA